MLEKLTALYNGEQLPLDTDSEAYYKLVNEDCLEIEDLYRTGIRHGEAKAFKKVKEIILTNLLKRNDIMSLEKLNEIDEQAVADETAELIGQSPWRKNACYQVYKCPSGKFALEVLVDQMACWSNVLGYIEESDVEKYLKNE